MSEKDLLTQKSNWQKYRHQRGSGRNDSKENLFRSQQRSHRDAFTQFLAALNILEHHNGIIHDQAGGQHQGKKSQHID